MKQLFALIMSVLALTSMSYAVESHASPCKKQSRVYVQAEIVQVNENGVFLNFDGQMIPVKMLGTDKKGLYVTGLQTKDLGRVQGNYEQGDYVVRCRECRKLYYARTNTNWYCSRTCRRTAEINKEYLEEARAKELQRARRDRHKR